MSYAVSTVATATPVEAMVAKAQREGRTRLSELATICLLCLRGGEAAGVRAALMLMSNAVEGASRSNISRLHIHAGMSQRFLNALSFLAILTGNRKSISFCHHLPSSPNTARLR